MTTTTKITSRRELANRVLTSPVSLNELSKRVEKTVSIWVRNNECVIESGYLRMR